MEILTVENLSFAYPDAEKPVLSSVSFSVPKGAFVTMIGATGTGKTTLLRLLKPELAPVGKKTGKILLKGTEWQAREDVCCTQIGYVMQNPEQQLVTDFVWSELAFGLENQNLPSSVIRRRTAETAAWFGISHLFEQQVNTLSGGQKQLLNLASVLVMQPEILLLDEPTAQLDPVAAAEFLQMLVRLNQELGVTILLAEHRLEDAIPPASHLLVTEPSGHTMFGPMRDMMEKLTLMPQMRGGLPVSVRLYALLQEQQSLDRPVPVFLREGQELLEQCVCTERVQAFCRETEEAGGNAKRTTCMKKQALSQKPVLEFSEVYARYQKTGQDVLRGAEFSVYEGEAFCLLGGNGSGKSTLLKAAAGVLHPYAGEIRVFGRKMKQYRPGELYRNGLAMLPQDVQTVFLCDTVEEELRSCRNMDFCFVPEAWNKQHPYDLSGGQQQLVALQKILANQPKLLLLDEPTKGLSADAKAQLLTVLKKLRAQGLTIVTVTHDVEFAAAFASRCGLFFRGEMVSACEPREFFVQNRFYTTAANRLCRGICDPVITVEEAFELCRKFD